MNDQARLTYLTRHYFDLQGMRTAPWWLTLLYFQIRPLGLVPSHGLGKLLDSPAALLIAWSWVGLMFCLSWLASRHYSRCFGSISPERSAFPKSRAYWVLNFAILIGCIYCVFFTSLRGSLLPYAYTFIWMSPLFNAENPPLRRTYYTLVGAAIISSCLFIQLTHRSNAIILLVECMGLLALGVADHFLLMSLRAPLSEETDA